MYITFSNSPRKHITCIYRAQSSILFKEKHKLFEKLQHIFTIAYIGLGNVTAIAKGVEFVGLQSSSFELQMNRKPSDSLTPFLIKMQDNVFFWYRITIFASFRIGLPLPIATIYVSTIQFEDLQKMRQIENNKCIVFQ